MQHILVLSVIILHHVDSYSCRTVAKLLQQPLDGDTDVTEYTQLKQRDRDITSIIKQLLERSSSEINSEHQKGLAKLTIEPYNKHVNKTGWSAKDPLLWFDSNKKTVAPLAIIVTNLPEITKIEDRDNYKEEKYFIQNKDEITSFDSNKEVRGNSKETLFDSDLHPNVKRNFTEEPIDELLDTDKLDFNIEDLDFSNEDVNISNNSLNTDIAWQSKEVFDELERKDASNENIYKSVEIEDKTHDDFKTDTKETIDTFEDKLVDNTVKIFPDDSLPTDTNKQGDKIINHDKEILTNQFLDTDLEIIKGNHNIVKNVPFNNDYKIKLKFGNYTDDVSTIENNKERNKRKCRDHRRQNSPTYNLSFVFNR